MFAGCPPRGLQGRGCDPAKPVHRAGGAGAGPGSFPSDLRRRGARLCSGAVLVLALLLLAACGASPQPGKLEGLLTESWQGYVRRFIHPEGRVVVPERRGGTISEAQAYALLRAVWAGD